MLIFWIRNFIFISSLKLFDSKKKTCQSNFNLISINSIDSINSNKTQRRFESHKNIRILKEISSQALNSPTTSAWPNSTASLSLLANSIRASISPTTCSRTSRSCPLLSESIELLIVSESVSFNSAVCSFSSSTVFCCTWKENNFNGE